MNTTILTLCLAFLFSASAHSLDLTTQFKPGDVFDFRIETNGKVIGTQKATCVGLKAYESDSLLYFDIVTTSIFERGGRTFDMNVSCEVGYVRDGRPRDYRYELSLLNAKVTHEGRFSDTEYMGKATRIGVTQPFNFRVEKWPLLLDNNFVLQWELAVKQVSLLAGDSAVFEVMIPQLHQLVKIPFHRLPSAPMSFAGQNVRVSVYELGLVNQTIYVDESGRLLKAVDKASGISVIRQAPGESVEVARESILSIIKRRVWGYLILFGVALVWYLAIALSKFKQQTAWLAFLVAAALYWLSLLILQPIQNAYFGWAIDPRGSSGGSYVLLLGSALIFAIIEIIAIAAPVIATNIFRRFTGLRYAVAVGAAAGAGFGFMQAANLTAFGPDGLFVSGADVLQKIGLIGLCTICGALVAAFVYARRPLGYYLIPIGIKALLNWTPVFVQKEVYGLGTHAVIALLLTLISYIVYYQFKRRHRSRRSY